MKTKLLRLSMKLKSNLIDLALGDGALVAVVEHLQMLGNREASLAVVGAAARVLCATLRSYHPA